MGMSPEVVNRTSFWQFLAAWNGYVAANAPESGKLSAAEADALFDWIDEGPAETFAQRMPAFRWDGSALSLVRTAA